MPAVEYYGDPECFPRAATTGDAATRLALLPEAELGAPPDRTNKRFARFNFWTEVWSGAPPAFACRLDEGAWTSCGDGDTTGFYSARYVVYDGLADGRHHFAVRSIDAAGEPDSTPAEFSWTVDTVPPETTLRDEPIGTPPYGWFFDPRSPEAGVVRFHWFRDGEAAGATWPSANWFTAYAPNRRIAGPHRYGFAAQDRAGNIDPTPVWFDFTLVEPPYDPRIPTELAPPWPGVRVTMGKTARTALSIKLVAAVEGQVSVRVKDARKRVVGTRALRVDKPAIRNVRLALRRGARNRLRAQRRLALRLVATLRPADGGPPLRAVVKSRVRRR